MRTDFYEGEMISLYRKFLFAHGLELIPELKDIAKSLSLFTIYVSISKYVVQNN